MRNIRILGLAESREDAVAEAVNVLRDGGLVIYPTETCYALGADALNPDAVKRVRMVKRRPSSLPLPVIVADEAMWREYAELTPDALRLIRGFSPGPLTLVLRKRALIPDALNPYALAARISSHPVAAELAKRLGSPIVSTSANAHGDPEPYDVKKALRSLSLFEGLVLDDGELPRRPVSTIADLTVRPYRVQRASPEGAIEADAIRHVMEGGAS